MVLNVAVALAELAAVVEIEPEFEELVEAEFEVAAVNVPDTDVEGETENVPDVLADILCVSELDGVEEEDQVGEVDPLNDPDADGESRDADADGVLDVETTVAETVKVACRDRDAGVPLDDFDALEDRVWLEDTDHREVEL